MVIERFWPLFGGSETQCFQLSEGLVKKGIKVTIVTKRWQKNFLREEDFKQGFKVIRLGRPGSGRLKDYLAAIHLLFWLTKNSHLYDLVYVNGGLANNFGSTAILIGKLLSKCVIGKVATPGELFFSGPKALSPKKLVHFLIKLRLFIAKKADFYTAHIKDVEEELTELGIDKSKIKKITNSVDENLFKPAFSIKEKRKIRKELSLPLDKTILIYCGRLVRRKGLIFLLEAFKKIVQNKKDTILVILGSGKNQPDSVEKELKEIIQKERLKNIYFLGEKEKLEVAKFLKSADIFIYPSTHPEGTALSILEAMSSGLPVLGTDVGGIKEMIKDKDNGILVDKKDSSALFTALKFLLDNPKERIRLGKNARRTVLKQYSTTKVTEDFFNFSQNLLKFKY